MWSHESWFKVFAKESGGWSAMSWQARGLYRLLQAEASREGVIDVGPKGYRWVAIVFRMQPDAAYALWTELIEHGFIVDDKNGTITLPWHAEQQASSTSVAERVRRHRERTRTHVTADVTPVTAGVTDVTKDKKERKKEEKEGEGRARDPKVMDLAKDLGASKPFEHLNTVEVAEQLIGYLGFAAMNIGPDKWRPAIAEAAVQAESNATEGRLRQILSWKFADLRDGKRRAKRPQGSDTVLADLERFKKAGAVRKSEPGEPSL